MMDNFSRFDVNILLRGVVAALIESAALIAVIFFAQGRRFVLRDYLMAVVILAVILLVLDIFSPVVGDWFRKGAGFGLGAVQVGFGL